MNINPVPSREFWDKADGYPPLPPHYKKPIGRLTKKRRRDKNEQRPNSNPHKLKRNYGVTICNYCGQSGHNSRTCQQKKDDTLDEEVALAAEATAAASKSQN
ncbi:hypothetical protein S83_012630 [Arachis hypogaea]